MKKKLLLIGLLLVTVITLSGCTKEKEYKTLGELTGIYKLDNISVKLVHIGEDVSYIIEEETEEGGSFYQGFSSLDYNNIATSMDIELKISKEKILLDDNSNTFKNGEYKRTSDYEADNIINDFLGIETYKESSVNGKYILNDNIAYLVETSDSSLRLRIVNNRYNVSLDLTKDENGHYIIEMFEDKYDLIIDKDKFELKIDSEDEDVKSNEGTYKKSKDINKIEIIKYFAFE